MPSLTLPSSSRIWPIARCRDAWRKREAAGVGEAEIGNITFGNWRARLDLLYRASPGGGGASARDRVAAGGYVAAGADEPGQLRSAVPVPGHTSRVRSREPDRCAAIWQVTARRRHGVPRYRHHGAHDDQWAFLSTLGRMTPREAMAAANSAGQVTVGSGVERISAAASSKTRPECPPVIHARLGAGIRLEQSELTPAFLSTLKHAASMPNPLFYERQRLRISTWGMPRFLRSFDDAETGKVGLAKQVSKSGPHHIWP
jgi:hypothetical protein